MEQLRSITITIEVETNKRSIKEEIEAWGFTDALNDTVKALGEISRSLG